MPNLLIINHFRLGDIVHTLPIAYHYHSLGWSVDYECEEKYHSLFELVDYATPTLAENRRSNYDEAVNLQVWPDRFDEWQQSGCKLFDFVYGRFNDVDRTIRLAPAPHIDVPKSVSVSTLVFPTGHSTSTRQYPELVLITAQDKWPDDPIIVLGEAVHGLTPVPSIPHLVEYIRRAKNVLTVNSAPTIIASAVRDSYHHIWEPVYRENWTSPNQVSIRLL
jgi:ADP-heptose:LPS heptosyltransferase